MFLSEPVFELAGFSNTFKFVGFWQLAVPLIRLGFRSIAMGTDEAEEFKKKGNDAFREQKWDEAIKHYNKAISLDPKNAAIYSNRSAAWSSKGNHESALSDADKCLKEDPSFVKGFARKGKALFDLNRLDEAEAAYNQGIAMDASNEACKRGVADVALARRRRAGSSSSGGIFAKANDFVQKFLEQLKKYGLGGRLQAYLVMFVLYTAYKSYAGGGKKSTNDLQETDANTQSDGTDRRLGEEGETIRDFIESEGAWLSYLHTRTGSEMSDNVLLLLHRTSSSAEVEFGETLPGLIQNSVAPGGNLHILAPDRPCHGLSPCQKGSGWLDSLVSSRGPAAPRRFAVAAIGTDAAAEALTLAKKHPEVSHLFLLSPDVAVPSQLSFKATSEELIDWLQKFGKADAKELAAAGHWAAQASEKRPATKLSVTGLPKNCRVTLFYGSSANEDTELLSKFTSAGLKAKIRSGANVMKALEDEATSVFGADSGSDSSDL